MLNRPTTTICPSLMLNWGSDRTANADGTTRSYTNRSNPGKTCWPPGVFGGSAQTVTQRPRNEKAAFSLEGSDGSSARRNMLSNRPSSWPLFPAILPSILGRTYNTRHKLTIRDEDSMQFGGYNADQEADVGPLRVDMGDLIIGTRDGLREDAIDMCAQRPDELVENVEHVLLKLVNRQSNEVHEVDQLCRFEVREKVRHERRDEWGDSRSCRGKDPRKGEACLWWKLFRR